MDDHKSVNGFQNWLSENNNDTSRFLFGKNPEDPNAKYIGMAVRSKVSNKKLIETIKTKHGSVQQLVNEFVNNGGSVLGVEPKRVLIETESGKFYLPRFCVKITKD